MNRINLLPTVPARVAKPRRWRVPVAIGLAGLGAMAVAADRRQRAELLALEVSAAAIEREIESLDRLAVEVRGLEAERDGRAQRLAALQALPVAPGASARVARRLSTLVPAGAWLLDFNENGDTLVVGGRALEGGAVAQLVRALAGLEDLSDVVLVESTSETASAAAGAGAEDDAPLLRFFVQARLRKAGAPGPAPAATPAATRLHGRSAPDDEVG